MAGKVSNKATKSSKLTGPTSPFIPVANLLPALPKFLPSGAINFLNGVYKDLVENKITREEMIRLFRRIVGDRLLLAAISLYNNKKKILGPRSRL